MEEEPRSVRKQELNRILEKQLLEKKHSSGDLQSRLKTRKVLGVGETDNGDVHRSKISQVLGHNEHLYVKFPKYFSAWHILLACLYTVCGLMNLLLSPGKSEADDPSIAEYGRLYGCEVLGFAILLWAVWGKLDKSLTRTIMAAVTIGEFLQVGVLCTSAWHEQYWSLRRNVRLVISSLVVVVNLYFIWAIGSSTAGLRKAASYKDLRDQPCEDATSTECPSAADIKKND